MRNRGTSVDEQAYRGNWWEEAFREAVRVIAHGDYVYGADDVATEEPPNQKED